MSAIRILDDRLVNKIAAGEVVERPASIIKELLENSLDAGAGTIALRLRSGGRQLIEVADDGCGMDSADAMMCLERHATSKIRSQEDLFSVVTLGFRGEALPSIASVCKFELVTRRADSEVGTRVVVEGGTLLRNEPTGCPPGTRIRCRQLFYNVPARRKFLRTVPTELGHCLEGVVREALIHPEVDWRVEHDGNEVLRAPRVESRSERAAQLLKDRGRALFQVDFGGGSFTARGLISPVGVHHSSASGAMYLYVNGRYVRDPVLRRAVSEAYKHIVPKGRYPTVVLEVQVPPADVDVNVHPNKTEVRFRHPRELQSAVAQGLREALEQHGIRRPVHERRAAEAAQRAGVSMALPLGDGPRPALTGERRETPWATAAISPLLRTGGEAIGEAPDGSLSPLPPPSLSASAGGARPGTPPVPALEVGSPAGPPSAEPALEVSSSLCEPPRAPWGEL